MPVDLELLCIDTRSRDGRTRPFTAHQPANNSFGFQVHAITADARLARSLWTPINHHAGSKESWKEDVFFDIRITWPLQISSAMMKKAAKEIMWWLLQA
jgi:hypothetical protein